MATTKKEKVPVMVKTGTEYALSLKNGEREFIFRASKQNYDLTNGDVLALVMDDGYAEMSLIGEDIKLFAEALLTAYEENK